MESNPVMSGPDLQQSEDNGSFLSVKDFVRLCMVNWYWFVLSVIVCLGVGCWYILSSPPVYQRSADILMRDDTAGTAIDAGVASAFSSMGMLKVNASVYDEVFAIKSPMIMEDVVRRLSLNVNYSVRGRFKSMPRYGKNLPYELIFLDGDNDVLSLKMEIDGDDAVLTDFRWPQDGESMKSDMRVKFDTSVADTLDTPVGRVVVRPNARYVGVMPEELKMDVTYCSVADKAVALLDMLTSEQVEEHASIIHLSICDTSVERAEDIINTLIEAYNQSWVDDRNQVAVATSRFIDDRLAVIEDELNQVDADISSYKSDNLIPDISSASNLYLTQANRMSNEIMELENQLQMARYIQEYLKNPDHCKSLLPVNSGVGSNSLEQQIAAYNQLVLERNAKADGSSDSNPIVVSYDGRISEMRAAVLSAIDNQIALLNGSIKNMRDGEARSTARIAANPSQARYLLSVERRQKVKESLYMYLLQKREENELGQTFAPYKTRVISDARGLAAPVSPRKGSILAVSFLVGLLIPAILIFAWENFDTTVRGRRDIEKLTIPYVGEIPQKDTPTGALMRLKQKLFKSKDVDYGILVHHGGTDAINEAFRIVRSNLEFMNARIGEHCRVIMVTSAIPGSGKTFVSMNLSAAITLKHKRVLLVDLDMRRHALSTTLSCNTRNGMSGYLAGSKTVDEIIVRNIDGIEGLDMVPAGAVPPNSSELLGGDLLGRFVKEMRDRYDYVIIDCPPTEAVADARIITSHVDMTLFVIRAGNLDRAMVPDVQQFYDEGRYTRMAIVLNGTQNGPGHSGSRYGYSYGYGYPYTKN